MAKDPAFLFYPNDYMGGTMGMSFEEKGAYMELLILQFNKGAFTIEQAKKCLNGSFERLWIELKDKFKEDGGKFFNERLEKEKNRRKEFSEKQRLNGKKGGRNKTKINPSLNPNNDVGRTNNETTTENEITDESNKGGVGEKEKTFFPDKSLMYAEIDETDIDLAIVYVETLAKKILQPEEVEKFWTSFKAQHFRGIKGYYDWQDVIQHFRDWLKLEVNKTNNGSTINSSAKRPSRSEAGQLAVLDDIKKDAGIG